MRNRHAGMLEDATADFLQRVSRSVPDRSRGKPDATAQPARESIRSQRDPQRFGAGADRSIDGPSAYFGVGDAANPSLVDLCFYRLPEPVTPFSVMGQRRVPDYEFGKRYAGVMRQIARATADDPARVKSEDMPRFFVNRRSMAPVGSEILWTNGAIFEIHTTAQALKTAEDSIILTVFTQLASDAFRNGKMPRCEDNQCPVRGDKPIWYASNHGCRLPEFFIVSASR